MTSPRGGNPPPWFARFRDAVARKLWGPLWRVDLCEPGCDVVFRFTRARGAFDACWKIAERLRDNPQVGYLAWKWMNGLQLDEGESVEASRG